MGVIRWSHFGDLNSGPADYKSAALPSYAKVASGLRILPLFISIVELGSVHILLNDMFKRPKEMRTHPFHLILGDIMADAKKLIRFEYKAYVNAEEERLYDTNILEVAKEAGIFNEKLKYAPMAYIIGSNRVFPDLDEALANAEIGKETEVVIPCEKAAGQRNPALVELFPLKEFLKKNVQPYPGVTIAVGNRTGTVVSVGAGRVKIDFNNQLAGYDLTYKFTVLEEITDAAEKAKAVIESNYNTSDGFDFEFADDKVVVMEPDVTKFDQNWMVAKYKIVSDLRTINGVDRVDFVQIWDAGAKE